MKHHNFSVKIKINFKCELKKINSCKLFRKIEEKESKERKLYCLCKKKFVLYPFVDIIQQAKKANNVKIHVVYAS